MKKSLIAFILSALTFFGGHYYNNRWIRSTFFSTLLILWLLLYIPINFLLITFTGQPGFDLQSSVNIMGKVWVLGLGLIWLSSAITAAVDAWHPLPV